MASRVSNVAPSSRTVIDHPSQALELLDAHPALCAEFQTTMGVDLAVEFEDARFRHDVT